MRLSQAMIAGGPLPHLTNFHEILTYIPRRPPSRQNGRSVRRETSFAAVRSFRLFSENLVKLCEPVLSLVCYHGCRGWGEHPVSLFLSLSENSATGDSRAEQHSQMEGERRAALHGRQPAANHHQSVLRHHCCSPDNPGA